jgi:hypothetical protein
LGAAGSNEALSDPGVAIPEEGHKGGCLWGWEDAGFEKSAGRIPTANAAASEAGLLLERELTIFFKNL